MDPRTEERADLRAGIIASTMENWSGLKTKGSEAAKPEDYMAFRKKSSGFVKLTPKQLREKHLAWRIAMGAVEVKEKKRK